MTDSYIAVRGERLTDIVDPDYEQLTNTLIDKKVFFSTTANDSTWRKKSNIFSITVRVKESDAAETYSLLTKHSFEAEICQYGPYNWILAMRRKKHYSSDTTNYLIYISEDEEKGNSFFAILEACEIDRDRVNTIETEGYEGIEKKRTFQDHRLIVDMKEAKKLASELLANDHTFAVTPIELESLVELGKEIKITWTPETLMLKDTLSDFYVNPINPRRYCKEKPTTELVAVGPVPIKNLLVKYRGRRIDAVIFKEIEFNRDCFVSMLEAFKGADLEFEGISIVSCKVFDIDEFCAFLEEFRCEIISFVKSDFIGKNFYKILQHEGIYKKVKAVDVQGMPVSINFGQIQTMSICNSLDGFLWIPEQIKAGKRISTDHRGQWTSLLHPKNMNSFTNLVDEHEVVNSPLTDLIYTVDEKFNYTLTTIHKFEASTD